MNYVLNSYKLTQHFKADQLPSYLYYLQRVQILRKQNQIFPFWFQNNFDLFRPWVLIFNFWFLSQILDCLPLLILVQSRQEQNLGRLHLPLVFTFAKCSKKISWIFHVLVLICSHALHWLTAASSNATRPLQITQPWYNR